MKIEMSGSRNGNEKDCRNVGLDNVKRLKGRTCSAYSALIRTILEYSWFYKAVIFKTSNKLYLSHIHSSPINDSCVLSSSYVECGSLIDKESDM